MKVYYKKHTLQFSFEAGTSRGVMRQHTVYFVYMQLQQNGSWVGCGECAPLPGLSIDYLPDFEQVLSGFCEYFSNRAPHNLEDIYAKIPQLYPSIRFGFETAFLDVQNGGTGTIFNNNFTNNQHTIKINGLVWMGSKAEMLARLEDKLAEGFDTIKLKIGAINFDQELSLLRHIRQHFTAKEVAVRVDANGAFLPNMAMEKIKQLSEYQIHSIEQPIAAGQQDAMAKLCASSAIPVALDEELIGLSRVAQSQLLQDIKPAFIILKPSLLGGFAACQKWIEIAEKQQVGWWLTSALESNVGLGAIAQFCGNYRVELPQGLGTGGLYTNNVPSRLLLTGNQLAWS
jgi:o-succinylbenzoate synthase